MLGEATKVCTVELPDEVIEMVPMCGGCASSFQDIEWIEVRKKKKVDQLGLTSG